MSSELDELIDFLSHQSPPIKQHAAQLVEGLTGSPEGIAQLSNVSDRLLPALLRLIPAEDATSRSAIVSLVNLAQDPVSQLKLLELNAVGRCVDYIKEGNCRYTGLLVMLLANLTAAEDGAATLVQLGKGQLEGLSIAMLLKLFLDPVPPGSPDNYEHVATILPNVTRFQDARKLLLEPGRGILDALVSQLRSENELRRRGCSGAIKNCCMGAEEDDTIEQIGNETDALKEILDTLCSGSGPPDADETAPSAANNSPVDPIVKANLAEAILCLAKNDDCRKSLWKCDAPTKLNEAYAYETDVSICDVMEKTAEFFLGDGVDQPDGVEQALAGGGGMIGGPSAPGIIGNGHRKSNVQIEELD